MTRMMAAHVHRYGPPESIVIADATVPAPRAGEVLVRVDAAAVTSGDARLRSGVFPRGFGLLARLAVGLRGPRATIPGAVLSGSVVELGEGVTRFGIGDDVAGMTGVRLGAHAQFVAVRESVLAPKPDAVSHADAAGALFGGTTALHFLRDRAKVRAGQTVLVNGASGAVGSSAVQLAARADATVTAVTRTENDALARRLGATRTIDYRETPVTSLNERFDVVFDTVGNVTRAAGLRLLAPGGALILAVATLAETITARGQVMAGPAPERREDFAHLLDLVARGELDPLTEVIGGLDALPEAHRRIQSGRKIGNIVVLPGESTPGSQVGSTWS